MIKKIIACVFTVGVLGGLAYYSGSLYSEKALAEDSLRIKAPLSASFELDFTKNEIPESRTVEQQPPEEDRQEVSAEAEAVQTETGDYQYYLEDEAGRVMIYEADRETVYEDTEITMDLLPEALQEEIRGGKGLKGPRELYDFLENYSS